MIFELSGNSLPWGDLQLFFGFLVLFILGGMLTFTPELKSPFEKAN